MIAGSGVDRAGANEALLADRRAARLSGDRLDGGPRRRAARPSERRLRPRRRRRPRQARGRRRAGRRARGSATSTCRTTSTGATRRRSGSCRSTSTRGTSASRGRWRSASSPTRSRRSRASRAALEARARPRDGPGLPRALPRAADDVVGGADARGRALDGTGAPPGARDAGDRPGVRPRRDLRHRRRLHVALGVLVPAADAPALVPEHPRARHARHGHTRRRSARSSAAPIATSCASPATARPASTSWRCSPPRARARRSPSSSSPRARGRWRSRTSRCSTGGASAPRWGRCAGTSCAQGLGCEGFYAESLADVESALAKARAAAGPVVICVRTDRAANLGVAPDPALRFMEVYQGPM